MTTTFTAFGGVAVRRALVLAVAASVLGGCGLFKSPGKDNVDPPAELQDLTASVGLERVWSHNLGDGAGRIGLSLRPAFDGERVFAADVVGGMYAFDAASGREVWHAEPEARLGSAPGVGEGVVVVGGLDGAVLAYDAGSGDERWITEVSSEVISQPAISGEIAVVRANDGRVFGLSLADGTRKWVFDRGVPLLTVRGNGAPTIVGDTVFVGYDNGKAVALALADGTLRWEQTVAQPEGRTELERMVDIDGPLGVGDQEIFAVTYRGQVGGLSFDAGRQLWSRDMSAYSGLARAGDALYLTDAAGSVWALDARSGTSLWQQEALAHRWLSTPAFADGYVVVGDFEGYVHVLKAEDGSLAARTRVGKEPIRGQPLAVGDMVYVEGGNGELSAFRIGS